MMQILRWLYRRLKCFVYGHKLTHAVIYSPFTNMREDGFRCDRCGHEQTVLYRWQELHETEDEAE